jgi:UDP-glucose 4-epimerase
MKILLTGASGFIGGHILTALVKSCGRESITALTSKEIPDINCITYKSVQDFDLNKTNFDDITHVIHAGAFTPKDSQQSNSIKSCFNNIEYTKELFSYDFKSLVRFVNLSTLDVYAATFEELSESSPIKPISLYGSSKLYCEEMVKAFSEQRDVNCINLRIGHVYGPGEEKYKKVLPIAIQNILENKPLELWGDGSDLRSFIFIDDVVQSILNSLKSAVSNIDINIVSGVAISIKDLLNKVIKVSNQSVKVNKRESSHQKRDLVFDNSLLLQTILDKETDLMHGLKIEYEYMKKKYENHI